MAAEVEAEEEVAVEVEEEDDAFEMSSPRSEWGVEYGESEGV